MKIRKADRLLEIPVIRGKVLGVQVYRGYARLCDLAGTSQADIYDQVKNPKGTQRDLNRAHARAAYDYVKSRDFAFWPEVFLCVRDKKVISFEPISDDFPSIGVLKIARVKLSGKIAISRVDGNHRLHYADGSDPAYPQIDKTVSFCLAHSLTREEEIQLFKDINDNQMRMNTSHLDNIEVRLTAEEQLKRRNPELYFAQRLGREAKSPFLNRVFEGGKKGTGVDIPLRSLKTGLEYMLSRSSQLPLLDDAEAQYRVIRNFFGATKKWVPDAWEKPKDHLLLRGAGLWAICFIGAHVIDRSLINGKFGVDEMLTVLKSGRKWDWSKAGDFKGYSGRGGALEIAKKVTRRLHDGSSISANELLQKIMKSDG